MDPLLSPVSTASRSHRFSMSHIYLSKVASTSEVKMTALIFVSGKMVITGAKVDNH